VKNKILNVLAIVRPEFDFNESKNFIEEGLLDSFDLIALVSSLDEEFKISIEGVDIVHENFVDLSSIENLLNKYVDG
jgi:acyl carrier protein